MPYASKKQEDLMRAVAHSPSFAKKVGVPQSVGRKFEAHKAEGGTVKKLPPFMGKETKAEEAKEMKIKRMSPAMYKKGEKAEGVHGKSGMEKPTKYAKGGSIDGIAQRGKTKGTNVAMKRGGMCK